MRSGIIQGNMLWDESGRTVVFELMGKRVFAYNAIDKAVLGKGQLANYEFYPVPDDIFALI